MLIIEDLQWADASTLDLLRAIALAVARRVVLVVTLRTDHPLSGTLGSTMAELVRDGATRVELKPFERDDLGRLVAAATGEDVESLDQPALDVLVARSGGNAFLALTLIDAGLVRAGRRTAACPPSLRDIFDAELAALDHDSLAMLRAAALDPGPIDDALLASVLATPIEAIGGGHPGRPGRGRPGHRARPGHGRPSPVPARAAARGPDRTAGTRRATQPARAVRRGSRGGGSGPVAGLGDRAAIATGPGTIGGRSTRTWRRWMRPSARTRSTRRRPMALGPRRFARASSRRTTPGLPDAARAASIGPRSTRCSRATPRVRPGSRGTPWRRSRSTTCEPQPCTNESGGRCGWRAIGSARPARSSWPPSDSAIHRPTAVRARLLAERAAMRTDEADPRPALALADAAIEIARSVDAEEVEALALGVRGRALASPRPGRRGDRGPPRGGRDRGSDRQSPGDDGRPRDDRVGPGDLWPEPRGARGGRPRDRRRGRVRARTIARGPRSPPRRPERAFSLGAWDEADRRIADGLARRPDALVEARLRIVALRLAAARGRFPAADSLARPARGADAGARRLRRPAIARCRPRRARARGRSAGGGAAADGPRPGGDRGWARLEPARWPGSGLLAMQAEVAVAADSRARRDEAGAIEAERRAVSIATLAEA